MVHTGRGGGAAGCWLQPGETRLQHRKSGLDIMVLDPVLERPGALVRFFRKLRKLHAKHGAG